MVKQQPAALQGPPTLLALLPPIANPKQPAWAQVTEDDIESFSRGYRGGEEERADVLKYYAQFGGDMNKVGGGGPGGGWVRGESELHAGPGRGLKWP